MERTDYFIRRFLLIIPTFIGITLLCFALIQFVPGGPVEQAIMQMRSIGVSESGRGTGTAGTISPEQRKAIEAHFGFDKPFYQRYWRWLVTDRLGMQMESYRFPNKTSWQLIRERFRVSLIFGITGFVLPISSASPWVSSKPCDTTKPLTSYRASWCLWGMPFRPLPLAWC